eukprot:GEMP01126596.1.p1 GENE.GEMP01126596.1~~GEMP01126596.1.p1  ORF type:complete len:124 (+),score=8.18 GEMP01126596.1:142-513(+)
MSSPPPCDWKRGSPSRLVSVCPIFPPINWWDNESDLFPTTTCVARYFPHHIFCGFVSMETRITQSYWCPLNVPFSHYNVRRARFPHHIFPRNSSLLEKCSQSTIFSIGVVLETFFYQFPITFL